MAVKKFFNTYGANPMACAAGRAVLKVIAEEGLQENAVKVGRMFQDALASISSHLNVGEVRGRGLMLGIEFVQDKTTRKGGDTIAGKVQEGLRERGVIVGRSGQYKNVLRINPPLCVTPQDAEEFADALRGAVSAL